MFCIAWLMVSSGPGSLTQTDLAEAMNWNSIVDAVMTGFLMSVLLIYLCFRITWCTNGFQQLRSRGNSNWPLDYHRRGSVSHSRRRPHDVEMGADTDLQIGRGRDSQDLGIMTWIEIETRTGMDQIIMTGYKILDAPTCKHFYLIRKLNNIKKYMSRL